MMTNRPERTAPAVVIVGGCVLLGILWNETAQGATGFPPITPVLVPDHCDDAVIDHVTIHAPANAPNTDSMDPSGHNMLITRCTFDGGDDCIAMKPSDGTATIEHPSCENILVTDCTFLHGHGLSIGGQTRGHLRHMLVQDCRFDGTEAGIRMKSGRGNGGMVEDVVFERLTMKHVKVPIFLTSYYPAIPDDPAADATQPVDARTPFSAISSSPMSLSRIAPVLGA